MTGLVIKGRAVVAEVFRAGIESVPKGQREGGASLGLSDKQVMRHIVLPQAFRNMLPALGNDFISMMKDSSLLSVLAVQDLTYKGRLYAGSTFRFQETYLVLTVCYLCITLFLSILQRRLEQKLEAR
jgi:polar amino acid transport system permease protein